MLTGRCGCLRWFELLGPGLAAGAVKTPVLFWKLARMDILTLRDSSALALLAEVSGAAEVALTGATIKKKIDCVQRFLQRLYGFTEYLHSDPDLESNQLALRRGTLGHY